MFSSAPKPPECLSISASKVAAMIGANIYCPEVVVAWDLLKQFYRSAYYTSYRTVQMAPGRSYRMLRKHIRQEDIPDIAVNVCPTTQSHNEIHEALDIVEARAASQLEESKEDMSAADRERIQDEIRRNRARFEGHVLEQQVVKDHAIKHNNARHLKKVIFEEKAECTWVISGRVDGELPLTEIKIRIKGLPKKPPAYDVIQCRVYMFLTGERECRLIERTYGHEERTTLIKHSDAVWDGIVRRIHGFLRGFRRFVTRPDLHVQWAQVMESTNLLKAERESILRGLWREVSAPETAAETEFAEDKATEEKAETGS